MTATDGVLIQPSDAPAPSRLRRWSPEGGAETADVLRLLAVQPWLVAGRDDDAIAKVRRNLPAVASALGRLGWALVVERDLVRLSKSPPPRRAAWAASGPNRATCTWFFVLVAAAEAMPPAVALGKLIAAAKSAAAEAHIPVTGDITERRAIARAVQELHNRGVVEQVDGDLAEFVNGEDEPRVLLRVHHTRLLHVIANYGAADPAADPAGWLRQVEAEADAGRRMRRRLVDDTVVHARDLDDAEADWLRRRVRGDDGEQLARAFGLHLERRSEGAAFVVPDDAFRWDRELGPMPFPAAGTVGHAALLICEHARVDGALDDDWPGWRMLSEQAVLARLVELTAQFGPGRGGWRTDLVEEPTVLLGEVARLLTGLNLAGLDRTHPDAHDGDTVWRFSPATARWAAAPLPGTSKTRKPSAQDTEQLPLGLDANHSASTSTTSSTATTTSSSSSSSSAAAAAAHPGDPADLPANDVGESA
jgi:uncharacterized protein (TIGR02678 family)